MMEKETKDQYEMVTVGVKVEVTLWKTWRKMSGNLTTFKELSGN